MREPSRKKVEAANPELGLLSNVPLAPMTTLGVGGRAYWCLEVENLEQIIAVWEWARGQELPVLVLGEGSNVLFYDKGFPGLVVRNCLLGQEHAGNRIQVAGGENLATVVRWVNRLNLSGMERLYGIPGTIAGAIVGNAGAYGQEIGKLVREVSFWSFEEGVQTLPGAALRFRYRHSLFKERSQWFILNCILDLEPGQAPLQEISDGILATRLRKYPSGLKCPGSFFKNVIASELDEKVLQNVSPDLIRFGKIPAGKLLDAVGARGQRSGNARIACHHANLFVNEGNASSRDILGLAWKYAGRVREQFGIALEPEVLIADPQKWLLPASTLRG